ncbi:MAG: hypothetical protein CBB98_12420 [Rhodobacteraceae bacterium TMED38]|nr:MAG: hypothetical protein CBB98_12420 [Rhodobacteraceae bacterium TMED38]|tara:strand:- start:51 stop:488 length:438 start_codon:yes stop_codon:yes gene_type:complete
MVDSILTNQAPVVTRPAENRSMTSAAVSNASTIPEAEVEQEIIDVTPRSMDSDSDASFSSRGAPELRPPIQNFTSEPIDLRPSLENFGPIEVTSERALENRIADIELRSNNDIDETSSMANINNSAIEAFTDTDSALQQSVDMTA